MKNVLVIHSYKGDKADSFSRDVEEKYRKNGLE